MNMEIPKVDGHCTFPVLSRGPSMRGSFEKVVGEAGKSLRPVPAKDSGLTFGDKFSLRRSALIFAPKRAKTRARHSYAIIQTFLCDHEVGGDHERFGNIDIGMILVWAPGLLISAYLTWGSPRVD
jgi:hypothetical protein